MKDLVVFLVSTELVKKMWDASLFERLEAVETDEAKAAIVQETERMVFEIVDEVFKPDEEIDEEGIEMKNYFIKGIIEHNYQFFKLPTPFEQGLTLDDVKERNGVC